MLKESLLKVFSRRHLLAALIRREVSARSKGSILGLTWNLIEPLFLLLIYTVVFHHLLGVKLGEEEGGGSFALYLFCGLLPYLAISQAVSQSTTIIPANRDLIKKVIFPSEMLPLQAVFANLISQGFGWLALAAGMMIAGVGIGWPLLLLPVIVFIQLLLTCGICFLVAGLGVFIRDTRQVVSLLLLAWLFATPIFYSESYIPERFRFWLAVNPMAGLISAYRDVILNNRLPSIAPLAASFAWGAVLFLFGWCWFNRTKKAFADVI